MSWRNQGITGSNNIPLGNRRRFGGDDGAVKEESPASTFASEDRDLKRGRSPEPRESLDLPKQPFLLPHPSLLTYIITSRTGNESSGPRQRKKRNRWGDASENKAAGLMGLPTAIMANMTSEQLEAYTLHLRIEEISQKLKINDVVPADGDR